VLDARNTCRGGTIATLKGKRPELLTKVWQNISFDIIVELRIKDTMLPNKAVDIQIL